VTLAQIAAVIGIIASALAIYQFFVRPDDGPQNTWRDGLSKSLGGFVAANQALSGSLMSLNRGEPATSARRQVTNMDRVTQKTMGAVETLGDPSTPDDRDWARRVEAAFSAEQTYLDAVRMYLQRLPMDVNQRRQLGLSSKALQEAMQPLNRLVAGAYESIGGAKQLKAWYVPKSP
jgi:hypothetical protein